VTEPDQVIEPKLSKTGFGSVAPKTVIQVLMDSVTNHGDEKAMAQKRTVNVKCHFPMKFCS
jgi:hypothetical protein